MRTLKTDEIQEALNEHLLWINSGAQNGRQANFHGLLIQDFKFNNANLQKAIFHSTRLSKCSFVRCNLEKSVFTNSELHEINFHAANLQGAMFQLSKINSTILQRANLMNANLKGIDAKWENFSGMIMQNASLQNAKLNGAKFIKTQFHNADLSDGDFQGSNFKEANLQEAKLQRGNFSNTKLLKADLRYANLLETNFYGADLKNSILIGSNLYQAELSNANLEGITIDQTLLSNLEYSLKEKFGGTFKVLWDEKSQATNTIQRCIEFPPEYHKAGVDILSYFGKILQKKFPKQASKVSIEQEGLKVTMVVDPIDGDLEMFERTLDEYGLVLTGKMAIDDFTDDRLLAIELKHELRLAHSRIEAQKELLQFASEYHRENKTQIEQLLMIVGNAVQSRPQPVSITISPTISPIIDTKITSEVNMVFQLFDKLHGALNELVEELPKNLDELSDVIEIEKNLGKIEKGDSPETVKKSAAMSKLGRFLNKINDEKSQLRRVLNGVKEGAEIAQKIASYYNRIAEWCGLPVVPKPFLGSDKF